jgi:hypothetical protein
LQIEARQRNADHPVGQHEPRAGFGQAKRLRHPTRADQGQEKLRPAQIEGVEFDFPAHQAPPVERNRRAVHRDLRLVGQLFRTQAHLVEDETFDRTEPHAVELQLQPRARRGYAWATAAVQRCATRCSDPRRRRRKTCLPSPPN